eukprot:1439720-Rhodomonas_salina.1
MVQKNVRGPFLSGLRHGDRVAEAVNVLVSGRKNGPRAVTSKVGMSDASTCEDKQDKHGSITVHTQDQCRHDDLRCIFALHPSHSQRLGKRKARCMRCCMLLTRVTERDDRDEETPSARSMASIEGEFTHPHLNDRGLQATETSSDSEASEN